MAIGLVRRGWFGFVVCMLVAGAIEAAPGDLIRELARPTPEPNDSFGQTMASAGAYLAVGAPSRSSNGIRTGSVYLFDSITGDFQFALNNPAPSRDTQFGFALATSGTNVGVSAPFVDNVFTDEGRVYIYNYAQRQFSILFHPQPTADDVMGFSIAFVAEVLVAGAPSESIHFVHNSGKVMLFDSVTGAHLKTITSPTPAADDRFGYSVIAVGSHDFAVGSPLDASAGNPAVYVFDGDPQSPTFGQLRSTLSDPSGQSSSRFGAALAEVGGNILVGAPGYDDGSGTGSGLAYLFAPTGGAPLMTMRHPSPTLGSAFGISVAASGANAVIGASDAAFLFSVPSDPPQLIARMDCGSFVRTVAAAGGNIAVGGSVDENSKVCLFEGTGPQAVILPMVFDVDTAMSDLTASVEGEAGMQMSVRPDVRGTIGGSAYVVNGRTVGFKVTDLDLRAADVSSDFPFHFELRDMRVQMGNGEGDVGSSSQPDPATGIFNQIGNRVTFEGSAFVRIQDNEFRAEGRDQPDFNTDFQAFLREELSPIARHRGDKIDGKRFTLMVPAHLTREVSYHGGPFNPHLSLEGMLVAHESPLLQYLLGMEDDPSGLDRNSDSEVDVGDKNVEDLIRPIE